ncbi:MAG TPA: efflux RND transporter periplasmic adaptor subunit [candidate division Zixibacteria bacterium]|nr:efflux RND transporter periplasmic adaptor subunit [candidate division Zixibacteria bacterium]
MRTVRIVSLLGLVLAVFAIGYWLGRTAPGSDEPAASHAAAQSSPAAMEGHDMSGGAVGVRPERQQLVGIRTAVAEIRPLARKIRTVGIVTYDETKVAQVFSKVDGWVDKLFVNYTGKLVKKGEPLFAFYSPDLVSTQEEYLLALKAEETLGSSSLKEISRGSASLLQAARRRLALWDITDDQIAALEKNGKPQTTLTFHSPISGFVLKKDVFQGMKVMPDKELYTIADLSRVWVNADVYEYELGAVRPGQKATISLSYFPGRTFTGRVSWISPVLDEKTRTAKVRLEFPNPDYALKPEMYANVEIEIPAGRKLAVPVEAVLDSGVRKVVFLDKGEGRFQPVEVKTGARFDGYYEVLSGLEAGERIIASANFLLDSESRLHEAMGAMAGMPDMEMGGGPQAAPAAAGPAEKKAGGLNLSLETRPAKPKLGENVVRLTVRDAKGNPVQDAVVRITAVMNMPGMAPLKTTARHVNGGVYEATVSFAMAGGWDLVVVVERSGQKPIQEKFTITAQ